MLANQKNSFNLPSDVTYLNTAYMGPAMKVSVKALDRPLGLMSDPSTISKDEFFRPIEAISQTFARLIDCPDSNRIAMGPSTSYGISNAARQIRPSKGSNIILVDGQFPSNVYPWMRISKEYSCELNSVAQPKVAKGRGKLWNESILSAIDKNTSIVAIAPLHWSDGTLYDLLAIRERSTDVGAKLIIDGSQAIGAMPFSVQEIQPDALFTAGYKWLFGPYGTAWGYYGEFFDDGIPIEENWITHEGCEDFQNLVNYNPRLRSKALKYSSGQHPAFLHVAWQKAALDQLSEWGVGNISDYCSNLVSKVESEILSMGYGLEDSAYRSPHLFGIRLPGKMNLQELKLSLDRQNISVSLRGDALRVSTHLFNTPDDLSRLMEVLKDQMK